MPVTVESDLRLNFGDGRSERLTPSEGFALAERLIRTATQRCFAEEVKALAGRPHHPVGKPAKARNPARSVGESMGQESRADE